jgi:hypothetical protein
LIWLKQNNPKYYCDVNIDWEALNSLPEDDVPPELLKVI